LLPNVKFVEFARQNSNIFHWFATLGPPRSLW
jgi:hypothetical protein